MDMMNIQVLVQEFYALEAMSALLSMGNASQFEPMRHSHERWYRDFIEFRDTFNARLASAIFDYTVMVVAAELRHCREAATHYIAGFYDNGTDRDTVYQDCVACCPKSILAAGVKMFDTSYVRWCREFGGPRWRQIARAGQLREKVSDCVFIDHCVDLSHNCNVYFDKEAGIFSLINPHIYKNFLDLKYKCIPQNLVHFKQGPRFGKLLWRANNLHIIETRAKSTSIFGQSVLEDSESQLLDYMPIRWGNEQIDVSESRIIFRKGFDPSASSRRDNDDCSSERGMIHEQAA